MNAKYTLIFLLLFFITQSCNSVNKVLKDKNKIEKVGREWEKLNPCNNDTIIYSTSDTVVNYDTTIINNRDTTIINGGTILVKDTIKKIITKTIITHDTINNYIVDNRRLNIALDSVSFYKNQANLYHTNLDALQEKTKDITTTFVWFIKAFFKRFWWLILLILSGFFGYKWLKAHYTLPF